MKKLIAAAGLCVLMSAPAFAVGHYNFDEELCEVGHDSMCIEREEEIVSGDMPYNQQVSAVPLPAAGWMLLAGIGGLVAMRRRARA